MGPFDLDAQTQRAETIERIIQNPFTPYQVKQMWRQIQSRLAFTEEEYNARVMYWYQNHRSMIS